MFEIQKFGTRKCARYNKGCFTKRADSQALAKSQGLLLQVSFFCRIDCRLKNSLTIWFELLSWYYFNDSIWFFMSFHHFFKVWLLCAISYFKTRHLFYRNNVLKWSQKNILVYFDGDYGERFNCILRERFYLPRHLNTACQDETFFPVQLPYTLHSLWFWREVRFAA